MKYAANIISISRIALSISMIWFMNNLPVFIGLYLLCGLSDILDGFVARKTNTQSITGAKLDSAADLLMFGIIMVFMIIWAGDKLITAVPLIVLIVLVRFVNFVIAAWKYHTFLSIHTWGNKIAGLCVFLTPIFFAISQNMIIIFATCLVAVLAAVEESAILITAKHLDCDRRSFFF